MWKLVLQILLFGWPLAGFSQGRQVSIKYLLQQIEALQITEGNDHGLFPSFREHHFRQGVEKYDDNVFMTALIAWTIRRNLSVMDSSSQRLAREILHKASAVYPRFQNASGRKTYNYWKTKPPVVYPNGGIINLLNKVQALPDDLDCTSITVMAMNAPREEVLQLHDLMQRFTNDHAQSRSMLPYYNRFNTYSTWFGKKMPVDMDLCVLANVLTMVGAYGIPYSAADSAALDFIRAAIERKDYLKDPDLIDGHYQQSSIILYHISRLMSVKKISVLEDLKDELSSAALRLYAESDDLMEKVILSTSLKRWGVNVPETTMRPNQSFEEMIDQSRFAFFVANMAVIIGHPYNKWLSRTGLVRSYYYCTALNYALILENVCLN
jgi:hypothetical protein